MWSFCDELYPASVRYPHWELDAKSPTSTGWLLVQLNDCRLIRCGVSLSAVTPRCLSNRSRDCETVSNRSLLSSSWPCISIRCRAGAGYSAISAFETAIPLSTLLSFVLIVVAYAKWLRPRNRDGAVPDIPLEKQVPTKYIVSARLRAKANICAISGLKHQFVGDCRLAQFAASSSSIRCESCCSS